MNKNLPKTWILNPGFLLLELRHWIVMCQISSQMSLSFLRNYIGFQLSILPNFLQSGNAFRGECFLEGERLPLV